MSNSNPTSVEPPQVSWQSAFWGLVALAINSMCHPAGKVCDAPRAIGPLMRASPIICFVDMLSIILRSAIYGIRKRDLREGCVLVMTQRYAYDYEKDMDPLSDFRYSSPMRWISFLASVSQVVKLFAFQGLLWTKIWAAMYLSFFLTVEIHVFMSRRWLPMRWPPGPPADDEPPNPVHVPRPHGIRSLPYISTALGVVFALFFLVSASSLALSHQDRLVNTADCTGVILLICTITIFVPTSFYSYMVRENKEKENLSQISLAIVLLIPAVFLLALVQHTTTLLAAHISNYLSLGLILLWAIVSLFWASATFSKAELDGNDKRLIENALAFVFFALNLNAALLYYRFGYDPAGTIKPTWTESLG